MFKFCLMMFITNFSPHPNCSYRIFVDLFLDSRNFFKLSWLFLELNAAKQYHGILFFRSVSGTGQTGTTAVGIPTRIVTFTRKSAQESGAHFDVCHPHPNTTISSSENHAWRHPRRLYLDTHRCCLT